MRVWQAGGRAILPPVKTIRLFQSAMRGEKRKLRTALYNSKREEGE